MMIMVNYKRNMIFISPVLVTGQIRPKIEHIVTTTNIIPVYIPVEHN